MAEQATRIKDQISGDYVATRDAHEQDAEAHNRVIQLMDFASRQLPSPSTLRGSTPVTVADGVDIASLPSDLTSNLVDVGDKGTLVVNPEHSADDGGVYITPIVFNATGDTVQAIRATKSSSMGTSLFRTGTGNYYSPQLQWDVLGSPKIGLHITKIDGTANGVTLKGGVI